MKPILFFVFICLSFSDPAASQNPTKKTNLYLLAGPSYLNIREITYYNNFVQKGKDRLGYSAGFGLAHRFGKHIFLNTRFLLERKRFELNYVSYNSSNVLIGESKQDFSKYYMTLCIIPQYVFGKYFNIGIGFYFSNLYKSTVQIQSYNLITFGSSLNQMGKYDHGISMTGGCTVPFKHLIFTLQLANNYGLQKLYPTNPWYFNAYTILLGLSYKRNR